ncbi:MAG: hypothetical protein R6U17_01415 [Thermoplasmata archaeon]
MIIMYAVFEVPGDKKDIVPKVLSDELVSRQSSSVRDGESLGFEDGTTYALIEGMEEGVGKAEELFKENDIEAMEDDKEVYEAIKAADEDAAAGVGTIFG